MWHVFGPSALDMRIAANSRLTFFEIEQALANNDLKLIRIKLKKQVIFNSALSIIRNLPSLSTI